MAKTPKHILVIRFSAMGDVAMIVPVIRAFVEQNPKVKITVLTRPFFAPFFDNIKNTSVVPAHFNAEHKGINGLFKLSEQLKKLDFDAIADLHNVLRTRILKLFLVGKLFIQLDKGRTEKRALVSGKEFKQLKSTHERYTDVFKKLGFNIILKNPYFPPKAEPNNSILKTIKYSKKSLIGIAPFAQYPSKEYPMALMEKVIDYLNKSNDFTILLFGGGQKEIQILNGIEVQYENVINIAGKLSFKDELSLISNLRLMLSMDSGNAHIAAIYGVEVVTLWGVTHPYAGFYPFNQKIKNALLSDRIKYPKIPTSVYGNKYPKSYENVMESIDYKSVVKKIESIIKKPY
jgi:ADP-heptose:LPS heptosyltransferase